MPGEGRGRGREGREKEERKGKNYIYIGEQLFTLANPTPPSTYNEGSL